MVKYPSQDYLLYWDRKKKAAIVASGRFRGQVWTALTHDGFFDRRWHYSGMLDRRRIKRLNYCNKTFHELLRPGLRKIVNATLQGTARAFLRDGQPLFLVPVKESHE